MQDNQPKLIITEAADFMNQSVQNIHRLLKAKKMEYRKFRNKIYFGHDTAKELFNIKFEKKIITFQIVKGGTGKTSLAQAFAIKAHLYGARVLCIDLDQQGSLSESFGIDTYDLPVMINVLRKEKNFQDAIVEIMPELDLLPSNIENSILDNQLMLGKFPLDKVFNNFIEQVKNNYDVIIIDCSPSLGQTETAAALASDIVVAPLIPDKFSMSGLKISYNEIKNISETYKKKIDFKPILNKFDSRTSLSNEILSKLYDNDVFRNYVCKTFIRSSQEFPNALYTGSNIYSNTKESIGREDINLFTLELLNLQNNKN